MCCFSNVITLYGEMRRCWLKKKKNNCFYRQRFDEDVIEASVMMIHTFNKDREKVKAAVDIISK